MLVLFGALAAGLVLSLIPFVYPETIMNAPGAFLNHLLGQLLASAGVGGGLVAASDGVYGLTLAGVLLVYGLPLLVVTYLLRTR